MALELSEAFTFFAPNYKHSPKYKNRVWDGKIRLFSLATGLLYAGLLPYVEKFAQERGYEIEYEGDFTDTNFSLKEGQEFVESLNIPAKFENRDYQLETFVHCIRKRRTLLISPTSSGKSLCIYQLIRYLAKPTLIIVPNTTLIHQLTADFQDYGFNAEAHVHKVYTGQEKDVDKPVYITTWQSAYKMPEAWFQRFEVIIADECHHLKAKSLIELMKKTPHIAHKIGFTGSISDLPIDIMVLEGLLGKSKKIITTKALMDQGYISTLKINVIVLRYPESQCKMLKKAKYQDEIAWLVQNQKRNRFIRDLALSLEGNTLILYRYVEKHGLPLYTMIKEANNNKRNTYLVHGKVDAEERDQIRQIVNTEKDSITVASVGCFSEGINIPNINNIIFASPSKSRILIMQSIGRGLRKSDSKSHAVVFDILDDLSGKKWKNHTYRHGAERLKYYMEEAFNVKQYRVGI